MQCQHAHCRKMLSSSVTCRYTLVFSTSPLNRFQPRKHAESDLIPKPPVAGHAHAPQSQDVPKFGGKRWSGRGAGQGAAALGTGGSPPVSSNVPWECHRRHKTSGMRGDSRHVVQPPLWDCPLSSGRHSRWFGMHRLHW